MSVPINHHIVSKVHTKNFFNEAEGKIYVCDKLSKNLFSKSTVKSLFSEDYSNSRYIDGVIDHISLEEELNMFFEKDFNRNIKIIETFDVDNNETEEVLSALLFFAKYGIIAEIRTPKHKKEADDAIFGTFKELSKIAAPRLKNDLETLLEYQNHVKHSNVLSYLEIADRILEKMGDLRFEILIANQYDYFFIPDFGAAVQRDKINEYFNPDIKEIAYVGLPLTSKIYVNFYSTKLYKTQSIPSSTIQHCNFQTVEFYNLLNIKHCVSKVACENESYLQGFIERNSIFA
jgi:hypothetical protein